jgi:DNA polymerase zeta
MVDKRNGSMPTQPLEIDDLFFTPRMKVPESSSSQLAHMNYESIPDKLPSPSTVPEESIPQRRTRFGSTPDASKRIPIDSERSHSAYEYNLPAPSRDALISTLESLGIPFKLYRDPHYSNPEDVPERGREFGGLFFELQGGQGYGSLEEWYEDNFGQKSSSAAFDGVVATKQPLEASGVSGWEFASAPPSRREVVRWLSEKKSHEASQLERRKKQSQIECPTQRASFVPRYKRPVNSETQEFQSMSIMSLEVFGESMNAMCLITLNHH